MIICSRIIFIQIIEYLASFKSALLIWNLNIYLETYSKMKKTIAILLAVLVFSVSSKVPTISSDYDDFIDEETTIEPTEPPTTNPPTTAPPTTEPPTEPPTTMEPPPTDPPTDPPTTTPATSPTTTGAASISLTTFVFLLSAISLKL